MFNFSAIKLHNVKINEFQLMFDKLGKLITERNNNNVGRIRKYEFCTVQILL